jgi:hypothetical protein
MLVLKNIDIPNDFYNFADVDEALRNRLYDQIQTLKNTFKELSPVITITQEKIHNLRTKEIILPIIDQILKKEGVTNYNVILNNWQEDSIFADLPHVHFIDAWLLRTYANILKTNQLISQKWNYQTNNILFLTGKPNRINRIGLLYKFWKQDRQMSNIIWSLYLNDELTINCKQYIEEDITEDEYQEFVAYCTRNPDGIEVVMNKLNCFNSPFQYNVDMYKNTTINLVSETEFDLEVRSIPDICNGEIKKDPYVVISEKIYKAVLNRQPFVVAGKVGYLKKFKSVGYRTFENYMKINDYDQIVDSQKRLDAIVVNTQNFANNHLDLIKQVNEDVEHNYNNLIDCVNNEYAKLERIFNISDKGTLDRLLGIVLDDKKILVSSPGIYEKLRNRLRDQNRNLKNTQKVGHHKIIK